MRLAPCRHPRLPTGKPLGALACVVLFVTACDSCSGCRDDATGSALARLTETTGRGVSRDFGKQPAQWTAAELGATFSLGDGVRSDASSTALLALADGSQLRLQQSTTVRFLADAAQDGTQALDVETGEAVLIASDRDLTLRTHVGLAVLQANGRLRITRHGASSDYRVEVGEVRFREASGEQKRIGAGESVQIGIGMALLHSQPRNTETPPAEAGRAQASSSVLVTVGDAGIQVRSAHGGWEPLARGEHPLPPGTHVRLPASTAVELTRGRDHAVLLGAGEFVVGSGALLVELRQGEAQLEAVEKDVEVIVPGGLIVAKAIQGGTTAAVRVTGDQGLLSVARGTASWRGADGDEVVSSGGEWRWVAAHSASTGADAEGSAAPDYFNVVARAGESFAVHAAEVPVAVAIDFRSKCKGEGIVELANGKQRGRGTGRANLLVQPGSRRYAVRCADAKGAAGRIVARGSLTVMRDAGTSKLPPSAPTSQVETDGRKYSIYYQNQSPDISVRWPSAPKAAQYQLEIDGKPIALTKPEHVFQSGALRDGTHTLAFLAQDRRSRPATVEITFDNVAPKASLFAPAERSFSAGSAVKVEGVALRGWKVEVDGGTMSVDAGGRFAGQVQTSTERPDIAVRLAHPRLGTHYYLRRAAGSR